MRRALSLHAVCQNEFAPVLRDLSGVPAFFATAPGSRPVRRHATRWALGVVRDAPDAGPAPTVAMRENVRLVVQDILISAGADAEAAERAPREGADEVALPEPLRGPGSTFRGGASTEPAGGSRAGSGHRRAADEEGRLNAGPPLGIAADDDHLCRSNFTSAAAPPGPGREMAPKPRRRVR
ncbi:hypothetical protein SAMN05216483_0463 [Streptomyces sp. 2131.1]|nr:hypothetical protein SAMN05216483_0463 [Streptomyces sp. 2131.1]